MIFAALAFLGAFLLFFVQPYLGKLLTPGLGGGSQVWVTCMVFFQGCLLLGYAYAHTLATRIAAHRQRWIHGALLGVCAILMLVQGIRHGAPLVPRLPDLNVGGWVAGPLLAHLSLQVGLPLVALSATSPLLQAWFTKVRPGANPYRLYAASNLGSLLGLFAYPFGAERFLPLRAQGWMMLGLFLGLLALPFLAPRFGEGEPRTRTAERSSAREISLWILTAAGGSTILMAGSTYLSTEVAAIPLLWILPLALYLLTFILVFESPVVKFERTLLTTAGLVLAFSFAVLLVPRTSPTPWIVIGSCLGLVFAGALLCHGCLYTLRPPAERLTAYYLSMAAGGVVGGLFVALWAPYAYDRVYELPVAVVMAGGIGIYWSSRSKLPWGRLSATFPLAAGVVGLLGVALLALRPGVWIRDFYGVVRVIENGRIRGMLHGQTLHGAMSLDHPMEPLTYFEPTSGAGQAIALLRERKPTLNIGVVGLGIGSLASYGRPGDQITFYEISPAVLEVSGMQGRLFPLLRTCPARVEVVQGDARLCLQRQLADGGGRKFDLLVVDAFNSDAVPWHLLTVEALQLYMAHLAPDGILALHISSPLPLDRVVCTAARAMDLYGALMPHSATRSPDPRLSTYRFSSFYALLARQQATLNDPRILERASLGFGPRTFRGLTASSPDVPYLPHGRPWTDDRSSLSDLLFGQSTFRSSR